MSDRIYVGTHKGLFTITRSKSGWRIEKPAFLGDAVSIVLPDRRGHVYAAMALGHFGVKLRRSVDGGATWDELAAPEYPPKPEGHVEKDGFGRVLEWRVEKIWSLAARGDDSDGVLWCGTMPGGLFRSNDGGATWALNRPLWDHPKRKEWFGGGADFPGIHSICVDPRDPRRVTIGVSCGGVWSTEDDGASWSLRGEGFRAEYMPDERRDDPAIQDPHCLAQSPAEPDVFWAQHHSGMFRSTDGARSFTDIGSAALSAFGFAVAVHPQRADTAWFVPAVKDECRVPVDGKLAVTRTRDGGRTFDVLREGLPQEHAYDLVYRHALDVDGSGKRLAFGSTTGSLWVSEDEGDRWSLVSTHLPPIFCVRFAR